MLIISIETAYMQEYFANFMIEIGALIVLPSALVVAVVPLRKNNIK